MSDTQTVDAPRGGADVVMAKADLVAAWAVLEGLAVSLDQIGGTFAVPQGAPAGEARARILKALDAYLTPALVKSIQGARHRLARYVSDEDAEAHADSIAYWDYSTVPKDRHVKETKDHEV